MTKLNDGEYKCCICGGIYKGWGNNPYPVVDDEKARCCGGCNSEFVIPARIAQMMRKENNDGQ